MHILFIQHSAALPLVKFFIQFGEHETRVEMKFIDLALMFVGTNKQTKKPNEITLKLKHTNKKPHCNQATITKHVEQEMNKKKNCIIMNNNIIEFYWFCVDAKALCDSVQRIQLK